MKKISEILKEMFPKEKVETIDKEKIISEYKESKEFKDELLQAINELGTEWFKEYNKENINKNDKNKEIDSKIEKELKNKESVISELEKEYSIDGYGKEPDIIQIKKELLK